MKDHAVNLYILNDSVEMAGKLRKYLLKRFGRNLNVSLFFSSRSCLRMIGDHVDLVVVDDFLNEGGASGTTGTEVLKRIKDRSPRTEVVIMTSHEDIGSAVEAMRLGARDYIPNRMGAWQRLQHIVEQTIRQPIRYFVAEYGVNVFMAAFSLTFLAMGVVTWLALRYWV